MSLRALRLLTEVSAVAAPDAAALDALLTRHAIAIRRLIPLEAALDALNVGDVALIGIGGAPAVEDARGAAVIRAALERGVHVEPIPGFSLPIAALVLSGLPPDSFVFLGHLPDVRMCDPLAGYVQERATLIVTVSAERLKASLAAMTKKFGDRPACLVNQPGAPHGTVRRGTLASLSAGLGREPLRGEVALVIGGAPASADRRWDEAEVRAALRARLDGGEPLRLAAKAVAAQAGWDRRSVYALGVSDD